MAVFSSRGIFGRRVLCSRGDGMVANYNDWQPGRDPFWKMKTSEVLRDRYFYLRYPARVHDLKKKRDDENEEIQATSQIKNNNDKHCLVSCSFGLLSSLSFPTHLKPIQNG